MDKDLEAKIKKILRSFDDPPGFMPVDGSKPRRKGKGAKFSVDSKGNVRKNFKGGGVVDSGVINMTKSRIINPETGE